MNERHRILFLILIMVSTSIVIAGMILFALYDTAIDQQLERLVETAQSQARLLEAIAHFDQQHHGPNRAYEDTLEAVLVQMRDAHRQFTGFGKTGEFTLAKLEDDFILFLLSHRHHDLNDPAPVPFSSTNLAEPMRRALSGESGTVIGLDYRGTKVIAAYEPLIDLNLGIVAKIDLAEIREPFIRAGLLAGGVGLVVVSLGALLFWRVSNPLLRQIEASEQKYRSLFDNANDSIFISEPLTRCLLDINTSATQQLGYTKEELLQLTEFDLMLPTAANNKDIIQALRNNDSIVFEHIYRRKDGTEMPVEVSSRMVTYGQQRVFQNIVRDITERKRIENDIRQLNDELEARVHERTAELEKANQHLLRLTQLKDEFVSNVSHELRTPITNLKLHQYLLGLQPEKTAEHLDILQRETERLAYIIENLLYLSRLDQDKVNINLKTVDLNTLIAQLVSDRVHMAEEIQLALIWKPYQAPLPVRADPGLMEQVISILLTNAQHYTPPSGQITVTTLSRQKDTRWAGFQVQDTGVGILPQEQDLLFDRFYRGTAGLESGQPGTGLGLALACEIIKRHGGTIEVASSGIPGEGSSFTVWLPMENQ